MAEMLLLASESAGSGTITGTINWKVIGIMAQIDCAAKVVGRMRKRKRCWS